jgi:CheY-like chemotaxis protein
MEATALQPETGGRPLILLVEDNPDDVLLARRALKKAALEATMTVVGDGDAAVAYLDAALGPHGHALQPALVLLDLKLPKRSGLEVLRWARAQAPLAVVPIVMLTSSSEDEDVQQAYALGANSYLQKPVAFNSLVQLLGVLDLYWLQTNVTAPAPAPNSGPARQ